MGCRLTRGVRFRLGVFVPNSLLMRILRFFCGYFFYLF